MISNIKPYEGQEPYVFISYCQQNSDLCDSLAKSLNNEGVRIWFDNAVRIGDMWPTVIAEHLKECNICILLMTNDFMSSVNCNNELTFAIQNKIPIIPLILEGTNISIGMQLLISSFKYIEFNKGKPLPIDRILDINEVKLCIGKTAIAPPPIEHTAVIVNLSNGTAVYSKAKNIYLSVDNGEKIVISSQNTGNGVANISLDTKQPVLETVSDVEIYAENTKLLNNSSIAVGNGIKIQIGSQLLWIEILDNIAHIWDRGGIACLQDTDTGEMVCVTNKILLGRDYVWHSGTLNDKYIDKTNTVICATENGYEVKDFGDNDQGSENGTWLNRKLLANNEMVLLHDNDKIQLGDTELRFTIIPVNELR